MSAPAIEIRHLGKRYRIGGPEARYKSLRESLAALPRQLGRRSPAHIWALRDVNFEVPHGEVVGIIGRNGAGKSTLLKILCRITAPTEGSAVLRGRVGSLLEVGTGFHPELTGRENIQLNAAILGMRRAEIARRFDDIVEFAGTGTFLDTPVKRYSSGMQMRLAFAVAAHLDAEILLVDEVLAVGDLEFQRRCLGKMRDLSQSGRTVLFVSHNLQAVKSLCSRGVLLRDGTLAASGPIEDVVDAYVRTGPQTTLGQLPREAHEVAPQRLEIVAVDLVNERGELTGTLRLDEEFTIRLRFRIHDPAGAFRFGVWLRTAEGVGLAAFVSTEHNGTHIRGSAGVVHEALLRTRNLLPPGAYRIDVLAKDISGDYVDRVSGIGFSVDPLSVRGDAELIARAEGGWGLVRLPSSWSITAR